MELVCHLRNGVVHGNTFRINLKLLAKFPAHNRPAWVKNDSKAEFGFTPNLQNQSVLYVQKNLSDPRVELLNPNTLSTEGTASLSGWAVSKDGKYLAYGISKAGSDWLEIHVMEIETKKQLEDKDQLINKLKSKIWG